ncbi:dihydroorotate dehydrogenase (quinone), partial [Dehalococcoidia bacterium]|nr:dihydroorotate dehydrogenase (quinone) [Dehalococcoidia bacterium]
MGLYETIVWPTLRLIDAERAHSLAIRTAGFIQEFRLLRNILSICCSFTDPRLEFTWKGLSFPNPIGLAAGADKDGRIVGLLPVLGFGFVEVGTVTLEPQPGNSRPRVFRFPRRRAMINSLGFPSQGSDVVSGHLARLESPIPLGINIGKNAETGLSGVASEYAGLLEKLYKLGDYFVMNVSSPNTLGLRSLQGKPPLKTLASELAATRARIVDSAGGEGKPVLIKISPDLTFGELDGVLDTVIGSGLDGVVATNTS